MSTRDISINKAIWFDYFTRKLYENRLVSEMERQALKRKIEAKRQQEKTHSDKQPVDQYESAGFTV